MAEEKVPHVLTEEEPNEILYFSNAFKVGTHIKIVALEAENRRILERLDALEKKQIKKV